jgi:hypothetical protein
MSALTFVRLLGTWGLALPVVLFAVVTAALAQSVTGSIQGLVVDQTQAALPGVTVSITNTATGATRDLVTDAAGLFVAELLPVGRYEVTASLAGFTAASSRICSSPWARR